jgi:hypothetical protein
MVKSKNSQKIEERRGEEEDNLETKIINARIYVNTKIT